MEKIKLDSYTLRIENGQWLGQVVLTSDGLLGSVTDYGSFSHKWGSTGMPFKQFILQMNEEYFESKIIQGLYNIDRTKQMEQAVKLYTKKILPALKNALLEEKNSISNPKKYYVVYKPDINESKNFFYEILQPTIDPDGEVLDHIMKLEDGDLGNYEIYEHIIG